MWGLVLGRNIVTAAKFGPRTIWQPDLILGHNVATRFGPRT